MYKKKSVTIAVTFRGKLLFQCKKLFISLDEFIEVYFIDLLFIGTEQQLKEAIKLAINFSSIIGN